MWDLTASKCCEVMTDGQNHPIQSLSMATNASVIVGANNKGTVYVFSPGYGTKASSKEACLEGDTARSRVYKRRVCVGLQREDKSVRGVFEGEGEGSRERASIRGMYWGGVRHESDSMCGVFGVGWGMARKLVSKRRV